MTNPDQSARFGAYGSFLEFRVLGPVQAFHGGAALSLGGPKQRTVLALLVSSAGSPVSMGRLIEGVYGDEASSGAKRTIHTYVSNLRSEVGDVIIRSGDGYVLNSQSIDAFDFERTYREGRASLAEQPEQAAGLLRQSLALWRGHAYGDVEARSVLSAEILRLEEMRLAALEARIEADLEIGLHHDLVGELEALAEEYPLCTVLSTRHVDGGRRVIHTAG